MTNIELLEDLFNDIEYITRLDFVDPHLRGEARDHLNEIYWKQSENLKKIKRDLEVLSYLKKMANAIKYMKGQDIQVKDLVIAISESNNELITGWLKDNE